MTVRPLADIATTPAISSIAMNMQPRSRRLQCEARIRLDPTTTAEADQQRVRQAYAESRRVEKGGRSGTVGLFSGAGGSAGGRHPLGRVPVLQLDDGGYVFESAAICMHLADLHPDGGLFPPVGSAERALGYQWTVFAMSELEAAVFGVMRARRAGRDESELAVSLVAVQEVLDAALAERAWLLGDAFSVPDIFVASILGTVVRRELSEPGDRLRAYVRRALDRPANVRAEAIRSSTA